MPTKAELWLNRYQASGSPHPQDPAELIRLANDAVANDVRVYYRYAPSPFGPDQTRTYFSFRNPDVLDRDTAGWTRWIGGSVDTGPTRSMQASVDPITGKSRWTPMGDFFDKVYESVADRETLERRCVDDPDVHAAVMASFVCTCGQRCWMSPGWPSEFADGVRIRCWSCQQVITVGVKP
jgi:hypothetical protein